MNKILGFIIFIVCIIFSCNEKIIPNSVKNTTNNLATKTNNVNEIDFLFFEILKNSTGLEHVNLIKKQVVSGKLKANTIVNQPEITGNLRIKLLDNSGNLVQEIIIENPLYQTFEVYEPEGLKSIQVDLEKAKFSIRYNHSEKINSIEIVKIDTNSNKNVILYKQKF